MRYMKYDLISINLNKLSEYEKARYNFIREDSPSIQEVFRKM
jgi:hypothetical protein